LLLSYVKHIIIDLSTIVRLGWTISDQERREVVDAVAAWKFVALAVLDGFQMPGG
jgi:hypothetical protein